MLIVDFLSSLWFLLPGSKKILMLSAKYEHVNSITYVNHSLKILYITVIKAHFSIVPEKCNKLVSNIGQLFMTHLMDTKKIVQDWRLCNVIQKSGFPLHKFNVIPCSTHLCLNLLGFCILKKQLDSSFPIIWRSFELREFKSPEDVLQWNSRYVTRWWSICPEWYNTEQIGPEIK